MEITTTREGAAAVLALAGRLDTQTAPQLQTALMAELAAAQAVTIDMAGIDYVSSAGLRVLLMGLKEAKKRAAAMQVAHVAPEIMEIFTMTGFDKMLTIV